MSLMVLMTITIIVIITSFIHPKVTYHRTSAHTAESLLPSTSDMLRELQFLQPKTRHC
jgi:hypothetical protein